MDKYLSVITNFGCHYTCPYCIVKNNNLQIPKSTLKGIDSLADEIKRNNCNWVSLSGGGDPIWDYENHKDWYNKFFDIVNVLRVKIELHTSITNLSNVPYNRFNRVVYHLHSLKQLRSIKRIGNEIIRVAIDAPAYVEILTYDEKVLENFKNDSISIKTWNFSSRTIRTC